MSELRCDRCDVQIESGAPHSILRLRLTAGYDGTVLVPPGGLRQSLAEVETLSEKELNDCVDRRMRFTLCPNCRLIIESDPIQRSKKGA